ncbi:glycoside hydrolase family 140 protein, partial [bacterium]|nr:glycoside hydrolase family 140 protein [bacterium]
SKEWTKTPPRPIINIEPKYEGILAYQSKKPHPPLHVRRASYWSLLCAPPAGITYGAHGVWGWHFERGPAIGHPGNGDGDPWNVAMKMPGAFQMGHLYDFFSKIHWWELRPEQALVLNQSKEAKDFIAASMNNNGDLAVVYTPSGGEIELNAGPLKRPAAAKWVNPRTGEWSDADQLTKEKQTYKTPDDNDWLLVIQE